MDLQLSKLEIQLLYAVLKQLSIFISVNFCHFSKLVFIFQELGVPKSETPDIGYLLINVELPSLCYKSIRPGIPCDEAMEMTSFLNEVCNNCKILDLQQLCLCVDKLVWVLSCDIYCLNYDGSVLDACLIAVLSALQTGNFKIIKMIKHLINLNIFP